SLQKIPLCAAVTIETCPVILAQCLQRCPVPGIQNLLVITSADVVGISGVVDDEMGCRIKRRIALRAFGDKNDIGQSLPLSGYVLWVVDHPDMQPFIPRIIERALFKDRSGITTDCCSVIAFI